MHLRTRLAALGVATTLTLSAGAASATTIHFNESRNWSQGAHTYGTGTETVSVEAFLYGSDFLPTLFGDPFLANWSGHDGGLGICSNLRSHSTGTNSSSRCNESHQVDGWGNNEIAVLNFADRAVQLTHITFARAYATVGELFDLFAFGNGTGSAATASWLDRAIDNCTTAGCTVDFTSLDIKGSIFGIGAFEKYSAFKVKAISFEYLAPPPPPEVIPLPAAGWLLLGSLGGLAAVKRRLKAV